MEFIQLELDLGPVYLGPEPLESPEPRPSLPEGLIVDQNRPKLLQALYERDGRDNPEHRHWGTFTGLAQQFHQEVGRAIVNKLMESPDFTPELLGLGATADG